MMKILVIDDNPAEQLRFEELCKSLGHDVTACATAKIALEHSVQTPYPLIVMKLTLPDMKVLDFCRQIRALPQGNERMLLAMIDSDELPELQVMVEAGMDDYLIKPIDEDLLKLRLTIIERQHHRHVQHRQVEEALRMSQTYAGNIIESSLDMIIAVDTERRIIEFNKAAQETFGYRLEEVLGKHVDLLYADQEEARTISRVTTEQGRCVQEIFNKRKNGEIFPCLLAASILRDAQGEPVGFMGISRDITARKKAEAALKKAHIELEKQHIELIRASKLKDEFLSAVSHELRTPLTIILGQTELLRGGIYGALTDRQCTSTESIMKSGYQLLGLIDNILDFSEIHEDTLKLEIAPIAVETVFQASLQTISQSAQEKRLEVSATFDKDVTTIHADEHRLQQVLFNLLDNAVKFTPEGGKIGLAVRGDTEQGLVHFTVWDTGIGIAEEDRERLFQPFVQLDSSLSRKYQGAGLGLSMVFHIVNMHGGSISIESKVGEGSRFTVSLPWQIANPSAIDHIQPSDVPPLAAQFHDTHSQEVSPSDRSEE